ncbi:MAG: DUF3307 domain-containing protein [Pseudomonadota bacterium]
MTLDAVMALGALLFVKHLLADGPLQTAWHVANKGVFGHPAGFAHAGTHAGLTAAAILLWSLALGVELGAAAGGLAFWAALIAGEFATHYAIDLTKCRIDRRLKLSSKPATADGSYLHINHPLFFSAFLADQTAHSLTYLAMLYLIASRAGLGG